MRRYIVALLLLASSLGSGVSEAALTSDVPITYRESAVRVPAKTVGAKLTVKCPRGTIVAGGGASISGVFFGARLIGTHPVDDDDKGRITDDGWRGVANNLTSAKQVLEVSVACAPSGTPISYSNVTVPLPAQSRHQIAASCPTGERVIGGGGLLEAHKKVMVEGIAPHDTDQDENLTPDNAWLIRGSSTLDRESKIKAMAVCANSGVEVFHIPDPAPVPPNTHSARYTPCPAGSSATGGGGIHPANEPAILNQTLPFVPDDLSSSGWRTGVWNQQSTTENFSFYAVCVE